MSTLLILATVALPVASPQHPSPALARAIARYDAAQVSGDAAELRRLLSPDYLLVNSTGATETRAQFIADLTAPGYRLDPFVVRRPLLRSWRGGAVAGGVARLSGIDGGKPYSVCLRFADVWAHRGGRWRVAFTQASRADPAACSDP